MSFSSTRAKGSLKNQWHEKSCGSSLTKKSDFVTSWYASPEPERTEIISIPYNSNMTICFWCEATLTKETKTTDHLISKPLMRYLSKRGDKRYVGKRPTVKACYTCNLERGHISTAFSCRHLPKTLRKLLKRLDGSIRKMRKLINHKLSGLVRDACLIELDELLLLGRFLKDGCKQMKYIVQKNLFKGVNFQPPPEDGWEKLDKGEFPGYEHLDQAIEALKFNSNLAHIIRVRPLRVIDTGGTVYASYNPDFDTRLPGCRKRLIQRHAYFLWEAAGRKPGNDQEYWFQAERELVEHDGVFIALGELASSYSM